MSAPSPASPRTPAPGTPLPASGDRRWWALAAAVPAAGVVATALVGALAPRGAAAVAGAACAAAVALAALAALLVLAVRAWRGADERVARLRGELDAARDESVRDDVTDLLNRRGLLLMGHQVLEAARRAGGAVHACVVEVTPGVVLGGPPGGAEALRAHREQEWCAVAAALRAATRSSDVVAREAAGRFLVLGPGAGLHAQELERRVRVGLAQQRLDAAGAPAPRLAVEVGAAVLAPWDDGGVGDLLERAEQSLAQRRALRRSTPQHGWGRRRGDRRAPDGTGGAGSGAGGGTERPGL
ncbi:diguanylate cyclase domain-containing protein [Kineococcus gypseus]|uniref:diguanylate cyclase domain-containing protein n=1 Tax=Kineococcus gypseus TaxID=1637102 RepID=UPI003D7EDDDB